MSEWIEVARASEFDQSDRKLVDLGGTDQIGLFKVDGDYYAVSAWCSHQKTSIVHGEREGGSIECPLHGARFDLRTGKNLCLPAVRPISRYDVKLDNGVLFIKK